MKKIVSIILSAIGLFMALLAQAQSTLYLSNLGEISGSSGAVGSDAWFAGAFVTGTNPDGYAVNSIQVLMDPASGNPRGIAVSIYRSIGHPESSLGSLSGVDPSAGGIFSYTASGITLLPSSAYFVVLTSATPVANGTFNWSLANSINYSSNDGWVPGVGYFSSTDGSSWGAVRPFPFQFAIYATAVPEPASATLFSIGGAALVLALRTRIQKDRGIHPAK